MKKIYFSFLISVLTFSNPAQAQDVLWMTSDTVTYNLNPFMPQQPACVSANHVFAARMTGFSLSYGQDIFGSMAIDCYDLSGSLMWSFPIGDSLMVEAIISDAAENVIVGGAYMETMHLGAADSMLNTGLGLFNVNLFLFSLDASGNLIWKRNVTLTHPVAQELSALGIDHQGSCWYGLNYFDSVTVKKLDPNGMDMQSHLINGTRSMNSFSFDPMGNLYITGSTGSVAMTIKNTTVSVPEPYMMFVTRIDAAGNCNWIKLAHDVTFQSPHIVAADNGDAYLAGNLMDSASFGTVVFDGPQWVSDIFLTKVDSSGYFHWGVEVPHQPVLTGDFERGKNNFIDVDAIGNVYMAGMLRGIVDWGNGVISDAGPIPSNGMSIISFDASGLARWQMTATATGFISPYSIITTSVDECYFSNGVTGEMIFDSVTTNQGNDYAFVLGKIGASTGVYDLGFTEDVVLYPNPADDKLEVRSQKLAQGKVAGLKGATEISIYNGVGEKVKSLIRSSAMNELHIDVSRFPSGIYLLVAGEVTKKFVVQH